MNEQASRPRSSSRRRFLYELGVAGIGGITALLAGVPIVGFFGAVLGLTTSVQWVKVCSLNEIDNQQPKEFRIVFKGENASVPFDDVRGVFVIRRGSEILAFTNTCTHMGCSVRWLAWRQEILCPCHGGMYNRWGQLMGGPPAASLPYYLSKIEGNDLYVANRIIRRGAPEGQG